jgi:Ulp1 family protease
MEEELSSIELESGQNSNSESGTVTMETSADGRIDEVATFPIGKSQMETEAIDQFTGARQPVQSSSSITAGMSGSQFSVRESDLQCLEPGQYLSENIIDAYLEHLILSSQNKDISHLSCHVANVDSSLQQEMISNIPNTSIVLIPIHQEDHFYLLEINRKNWKRLQVNIIDSLEFSEERSIRAKEIAENVANAFSNSSTPMKKIWEIKRKDSPKQDNGYDCGIFVLINAENLINKKKLGKIGNVHARSYRVKILKWVKQRRSTADANCSNSNLGNEPAVMQASLPLTATTEGLGEFKTHS